MSKSTEADGGGSVRRTDISARHITRFSDRVEDYVKYRPNYPEGILGYFRVTYGFGPGWTVADIGSGTGISTELLLRNGNRVYAVEPNDEMRGKAEELLAGYPGFLSVNGTAEATGLGPESVDLVVAGQAFHWFDARKSRVEFLRILKPGGIVALIWNERLTDSPFERDYEALIRHYSTDYQQVDHRNITDDRIGAFFSPDAFALTIFPNEQRFDLTGLTGRLLSSSYIPKEGPGHAAMLRELEQLFGQYASGGKVRVGYATKVYTGTLHSL
jgi:SAM-dependent methyltransferase